MTQPEHSATDLTLRQAQTRVDEWIRTVGIRYYSELTNLAILTEEVGEVARLAARRYGEQSFKLGQEPTADALQTMWGEELADVLFVLICLANQTGVDLTDELDKGFAKRNQRDTLRHSQNPKLKADDTH
jgi:NTP pyrophosphatase (non-canonical NTP hydrolase)